jgi:CO/xanthine dehydrogenase Mo-binding subunit
VFEIERYELSSGPAYVFEPARRDFFKLLGGGMLVLLLLPDDAAAQESGSAGRRGPSMPALPQQIGAWLHISPDNRITVMTGKVEVGQNSRTALTQAVAEELHTAPAQVELVMGDTALTPFDMGTFGSRTTPTMAPQLRRVAITAREALIDLAADLWHTDRAALRVENGRVSKGAQSASFGELCKGKDLVKTVAQQPVDKPLGQSVPKVNAREIVTGAHQYASDIKRPGMLYGRIVRPPAYASTLVSVDTAAAERTKGVHVVHDRDFIGVVALDSLTASRAASAVQTKWESAPQPSSKDIYAYLKNNPEGESRPSHQSGSIEDGLKQAAHKLDSEYTIAYIAHVPLEPRAAVAEWNSDRLTVWTGTQRPFGVRTELAKAFQIPEANVRVIMPDTGSAYGGKHTGECAIEAARLAKSAGKPVKLVWTREEEFEWAYFRPAGVIEIHSGVTNDGLLSAWEYHNYNSGGSGIDTPYDVPNQHIEFHPTKSPLRQGSYRGLAATGNHFARESHMDELAHAAGLDPLEFRLKNLKNPRIRAVLEAAAKQFGWSNRKRGSGLACGFEKGGYIASCASLATDGRIERVVTAFECGAIVNPEHLKNQVEGAVIMAIGGALFESIEFENGKVLNGKLSRYRVPRFTDVPVLETILIDRKDLNSAGAGETPIMALAPAVGNAIFDMTGVRVRSMPMRREPALRTD